MYNGKLYIELQMNELELHLIWIYIINIVINENVLFFVDTYI